MCLSSSVADEERKLLDFFEDVERYVMGTFLRGEVEAKVLGRDSVPEAGGSESVVGVHLILQTAFLVVDLLEVVDYFYIALDRGLLLVDHYSLPDVGFLLPLLLVFTDFFVEMFG